jgi:2,4-dienoyl-CoA reductase (NADPH2)
VNPRAARETELVFRQAAKPRRVCVVGAGPAGLACAVSAAECGHHVTLFEQGTEIGGQFCFAREVPGKEEFHETLRYFARRIDVLGVDLRLGTAATTATFVEGAYDDIVLAAGVRARVPQIPGIEHPKVITYPELLSGQRVAGDRVAIVGAGGIGFDVATFLTAQRSSDPEEATREYCAEWGIDMELRAPGGLLPRPTVVASGREIHLLQRKETRPGATLGRTTGWAHRTALLARGVKMRSGVMYERIDDRGLHISTSAGTEVLDVDSIVICAGQESRTELLTGLPSHLRVRVIGGALLAAEIDAERAIREGAELAATL